MYAIIENGGKQYKAVEGSYIEIDLLPEEVGKKKTFDKVMLLSTDEKVEVGSPFVKGVSVDGTIISHFKAPKLIVFKYRAKQRYRVKTGHRQKYTRVLVDSIAFPGKAASSKKAEKETEATAKKPAAKKTTTKKTTSKAKEPSSTTKKPAAKTTKAAKKTATSKKPAAKTTTAAKKTTTPKKTTQKKPAAKKTSTADKK